MTVSRILEAKGSAVVAVSPADTVQTIIDTLARHRVGVVVVTDEKQAIAGIISERDVMRVLSGNAASVLGRTAEEIMTRKVVTCAPSDPEAEVMQRMSEIGVRHLPVMVDGRVAGIVSMRDVIKLRIEKIDELMRSIELNARSVLGM